MIRRVALEDLDEVIEIERACFPVAWEYTVFLNICLQSGEVRLGKSKVLFMDVLEKSTKVVGYAVWEMDTNTREGHILNLAVKESERKSGKGTMLLSHVLNHLRTNRIRTCYLEVRESNISARRLYESNGFVVSHKVPDYYFDEDAIIYSIVL